MKKSEKQKRGQEKQKTKQKQNKKNPKQTQSKQNKTNILPVSSSKPSEHKPFLLLKLCYLLRVILL